MQTLKVDSKQRVRLPNIRPGQVFAYEEQGEGRYVLTLVVKTKPQPQFPRGSLLKYLTPERDKEQLAILKGCLQGPPQDAAGLTPFAISLG